MEKRCVFSGSEENLNTSMRVKLEDGTSVEVWVSDAYADDATPGKVREAYVKSQTKRNSEMEDVMRRAKELGLILVENKPAPAAELEITRPKPQAAPKIIPELVTNAGNRVVDGRTADSRSITPMVSGTATYAGSSVSGAGKEYSITGGKDKPSEDLKAGEKAEIGMVKGRLGTEVAIPVHRVGRTGETRVAVIDTGGDPALQKRFKALKDASDAGQAPDFIRGGYSIKTVQCGLCRGTGSIQDGRKTCPKCGGVGSYEIQQS